MSYHSRWVRAVILLVGLLLLTTLACGPNIDLPEAPIPSGAAETAEAVARQAGDAAQTAVQEAGQAAETVAALATEQGSAALATIQAAGTPDVDTLRRKLADVKPDENGDYRVTITEQELNQVIQLRQLLAAPGSEQQLQETAVRFADGRIHLSARTTLPLRPRLTATFSPTVQDGALRLELASATLAGAEVPGPVLRAAEAVLNSTLGEALNQLPDGVQLQEISVQSGELTVVGRLAV